MCLFGTRDTQHSFPTINCKNAWIISSIMLVVVDIWRGQTSRAKASLNHLKVLAHKMPMTKTLTTTSSRGKLLEENCSNWQQNPSCKSTYIQHDIVPYRLIPFFCIFAWWRRQGWPLVDLQLDLLSISIHRNFPPFPNYPPSIPTTTTAIMDLEKLKRMQAAGRVGKDFSALSGAWGSSDWASYEQSEMHLLTSVRRVRENSTSNDTWARIECEIY